MAILSFDIKANYEELLKAQAEVAKLRKQITSSPFGPGTPQRSRLEAQLFNAQRSMQKLEATALRSGLNIEEQMRITMNKTVSSVTGMVDSISAPLRTIPAMLGIGAFTGFLNQMKTARAMFEEMETSINVLVGKTKGEKLFAQLAEFAKISPLDYRGVVNNAKQMLGFGIEAEKIPRFLQAISDVSMGDGRRFSGISLAFSQMSATGRLMGQDLNQMINQGFNPLATMAEKTGKSIGKLKEEMSKGKITAEMVQQAFIDATSEGGKYYQMSEKGSATIDGKMSMLGDSIDAMYNELGKGAEGPIKAAIDGATRIVDHWQTVGTAAVTLAGAIGIYKTSLIAASYAQKVAADKNVKAEEERVERVKAGLEEEIQKRKEAGDIQRIDKNYDRDISASIRYGGLSEEEGKRLQGLRQRDVYAGLDERGVAISAEAKKLDAEIADIDAKIKADEEKLNQLRTKLADPTLDPNDKNDINNEVAGLTTEVDNLRTNKADAEYRRERNAVEDAELQHEYAVIRARQEIKAMEIQAVANGQDPIVAQSKERIDALKAEHQAIIDAANNKVGMAERSSSRARAKAGVAEDAYRDAVTTGASQDIVEAARADADAANAEWEKANKRLKRIKKERDDIMKEHSGVINALDDATSQKMGSDQRVDRLKEATDTLEAAKKEEEAARIELEAAKTRSQMPPEGATNNNSSVTFPDVDKATADYEEAVMRAVDAQNELREAIADTEALDLGESGEEVEGLTEALSAATEALGENTEEEEEAAAASQSNAAARGANTSATQGNTTATQGNSAATGTNTASQAANAGATRGAAAAENLSTAAKVKGRIATMASSVANKVAAATNHLLASALTTLKTALDGVKAAWATNPIGLIVTGVTMAIGALATFKSYEEEAKDETIKFGEDTEEARNKVDLLFSVLKATDASSRTYKDSLEELTDIAKNYGIVLDEEKDIYQQLCEKRKRLIELIQQEGRERIMASQLAKSQKQVEKADEAITENVGDYVGDKLTGDAENASEAVTAIITQSIKKNQEKLLEMSRQAREALQAYYAATSSQDPAERAKIDEYAEAYKTLREEMYKVATSKVKGFLSELGIKDADEQVKALSKLFGTFELDNLIEESAEAEKGMKAMATAAGNAKDGLSNLREEANKPIKDKEDKVLLKELREAISRIEEINNKPVAPKTNIEGISDLIDKAGEAKGAVKDVDNAEAKPKTDSSELDEAKQKAEEVKGAQKDIDEARTKVHIDVSEVIEAINAMQSVKRVLKDVGGNVTDLHFSAAQGKQWDNLIKKYSKNGRLDLSALRANETDNALYESLLRSGQNALTFRKEGKDYKMTDTQAKSMDYFRNKYANKDGKIVTSKMSAEDRAVWDSVVYEIEQAAYDKAQSDAQETIKTHKADLERRIKEAKTSNEISAIKKEISTAQNETASAAEYKYYEGLIKKLDNKDLRNRKRNGEEEEQRKYNQRKREEEETRRRKQNAIKEEERLEDMRIAVMAEGYDKEIALIQASETKKRNELNKAAEDEVQRLKNLDRQSWVGAAKDRKEYRWEKDGRTKSDDEYLSEAKKNIGYQTQMTAAVQDNNKKRRELAKQEIADMAEYLIKYGDYYEQLLALERKYQIDMANAKSQAERMTISREYQQQRSEKEQSHRHETADNIARRRTDSPIFEILGDLQMDALQRLEQSLKELMENSNLSADALDDVSQRLGQVRGEMSQRNSVWGQMFSSYTDPLGKKARQRELQAKADTAKDRYEASKKRREEADERFNGSRQKIADMVNKQTGNTNYTAEDVKSGGGKVNGWLMKLFKDNGGKEEEMTEAMAGMEEAGEEQAAAAAQQAQAAGEAAQASSAASAAGAGGGGGAALTGAIIHKVNEELQNLVGFIDDLGLSETAFGQGMSSFAESSQYATQAFDDFKSGNVVGVVANIHNALGSLGNALGAWGIGGMGESDINLQKDIERLTASNEALMHSIDMLAEEMMEGSVVDTFDIRDSQLDNLVKSAANTAEMMQRSAAAYNNGFLGIHGKHSSNKVIDDELKQEDWRRISKAAGVTVRGAADFFGLTSEQMYKVAKDLPELYAQIKQLADDGCKDAAQFMDEYIEYGKQIEEIKEQAMEKVTNTSFDSLKGDFLNTLMDMEGDADDFARNFEDTMRNAVLNAMVSNIFEGQLKTWYEKFANAMGEDGQMDTDEMAALKAEYKKIAEDALNQRKVLNETLGLDEVYKQEASRGSWETMAEDTGQEINGRFAALQIAGEAIRAQNEIQTATLATISNTLLQQLSESTHETGVASRIEAEVAQCFVELQSIASNTAAIVKPIIAMQSDLSDIKTYTKKL